MPKAKTQPEAEQPSTKKKRLTPFGKGEYLYKVKAGMHACKRLVVDEETGKEVWKKESVEKGDLFYSETDLSYINHASTKFELVDGPDKKVDKGAVKTKVEKHTMEKLMNSHSQDKLEEMLNEAELPVASSKAENAKVLADYLNSLEEVGA